MCNATLSVPLWNSSKKCFNIVKKLKCKSKPEDSVQSKDDVIKDMSKGNYRDLAICALPTS